jgi:hypothetical protein
MLPASTQQPGVREAGNDAPANQHDESDKGCDPDPARDVRSSRAPHFGVETNVRGSKQRHKNKRLQVTPIAADDNFAGDYQQ